MDRVLSKFGLGSRTQARRWIAEGRVAVNGKVLRAPDAWVDPVHNRQVRRTVEALGAKALKLVRTRIGPIEIGGLEIGKWRNLTKEELKVLREAGRGIESIITDDPNEGLVVCRHSVLRLQ